MVRHKPGFLKRKSQVMEQCTDILPVVEHTELAPDQHPDEDRGPTGGLTSHYLRSSLKQLHQTFLLLGSQLRSATTAMAVVQTLPTLQPKSPLPAVETDGADAPACAQHCHGHVVHQEVNQHRGPPYQTYIVFEVGLLQLRV